MPDINHVIVLVLENRSFDHMLGFLNHPDPQFERLTKGTYTNPGYGGMPAVPATPAAKPVLPIGPDHSHDGVIEQLALDDIGLPTNQGFVSSLELAGRTPGRLRNSGIFSPFVNWARGVFHHPPPSVQGRGPFAMLCHGQSDLPVLSQLALGFTLCTRWFSSVPGETWPNRNYLHAATSDGETDIDLRFYDNPTIFELLEEYGAHWHIYYDDTPQVWAFPNLWNTPTRHANWYEFPDFFGHVAAGTLPEYSFIEPNHRPPLHLMDEDPTPGTPDTSNNQHPENNLITDGGYAAFAPGTPTDFARAETLIARVYEALRANPTLFERSLLLVTYDEHGGFYDHVPPPADVPNPGTRQRWKTRFLHMFLRPKAARFNFKMLGVRVPSIVISPYVPAGKIDDTVRDHSSVPKTLRELFAVSATKLTDRDDWAEPFHVIASLDTPRADLPDLSAFCGDHIPLSETARAGVGATPEGARGPVRGRAVPPYYQAFVRQAEHVHRRLVRLHEDEATTPLPAVTPMERAAEITQVFASAAQRHRDQGDGQHASKDSRETSMRG